MMNSFKGELSQGATQQIEALSGGWGDRQQLDSNARCHPAIPGQV